MLRFRVALLLPLLALAACDNTPALEKPGELTVKEQNLLSMADSTRAGGNLDAAASLYQQVAENSTGQVVAHLSLASLYRQQHKPAQAVAVLRAAEKLQPKNTQVLVALGGSLVADHQAKASLPVFEQALALNAQDITALGGKGVALDSLGQHAQAQELYHRALGIDPENMAVRNNLALSLVLSDQVDEAISILEKLVDSEYATATMRQNLALAYGLKGDRKKALELGLKDLPAKQAQENLKFYEYYQSHKKSGEAAWQAVPVSPVQAAHTPEKPAEATEIKPEEPAADKEEEKPVDNTEARPPEDMPDAMQDEVKPADAAPEIKPPEDTPAAMKNEAKPADNAAEIKPPVDPAPDSAAPPEAAPEYKPPMQDEADYPSQQPRRASGH